MAKHHSHQQTKPRLLDQVCNVLRLEHYSYRTEEAYVQWIKRFIVFNGKHHPEEMGEEEVSQFLTWLARSPKPSGCTFVICMSWCQTYKIQFS